MKSFAEKLLLSAWLALTVLAPGICAADSMSGLGDLTITTLDASAQNTLMLNGVIGANQTENAAINDCSQKATDAGKKKREDMSSVMTYSDPVKKLNDSVNTCFANIQTISVALNFPTISFTAMFQAALKQLLDRLVNDIIMKICAAATGAWNSAVGNAIDTLNSGINQSGVNTFGSVVTVSPAPMSPAPAAPAPLIGTSAIPGL